MSDIVERLEQAAATDSFFNARQLKLEAAAEIKRLRAREGRLRATLRKIAEHDYSGEDERLTSSSPRMIWELVARRELERKDE